MSGVELVQVVAGVELVDQVEQLPDDQRPDLVYLSGLSTLKGRRAQSHALDVVAALLGRRCSAEVPWHRLQYQHTRAIRTRLLERGYAPATVNRILCALRGTLREAARLGLMTREACEAACDLAPARGERPMTGRALEGVELAALRSARPRESCAGARDAALVAVLYLAGLRRAELVALDLVDFTAGQPAALLVQGKGGKHRIVYLQGEHLEPWLEKRGREPGPLFYPVDRFDRIQRRRMTDQAVLHILRAAATRGAVAHFTPHDLRRTCISDLLDVGVDLPTAQKIAGHASPATTARYDRRGDQVLRAAAGRLVLDE